MNILLTSIGRRSYLLDWFIEANPGGKIIVASGDETAVGYAAAQNKYLVPYVNDPNYTDCIKEICSTEQIDLVVPLLDEDVLVLSSAGLEKLVLSPPYEQVLLCCDKLLSHEWMVENDIPNAPVELAGDEDGWLVKPRFGTGSGFMHGMPQSLIKQKKIDGVEYGLTVLNDLDGNYVKTFVVKKLAMRSGETDKATTVWDSELEGLGRLIGTKIRQRGPMDVDVIRSKEGCAVIDINPRFGGTYPFVHLSGVNIPAVLVRMYQSKSYHEFLYMEEGVSYAKGICFSTIRGLAM